MKNNIWIILFCSLLVQFMPVSGTIRKSSYSAPHELENNEAKGRTTTEELLRLQQHQNQQDTILRSILGDMEQLKVEQNQEILELKRKVRSQEQILQDLRRDVKKQGIINMEQSRVIQEQNKAIQDLETIINSRDARSDDMGSLRQDSYEELSGEGHAASAPRSSSVQYQQTAFGCLDQTLQLSCPDNRVIEVTMGNYGQYHPTDHPCTEGCCPPHPTADCTEVVADNRPSDWAAIKASCDNKTSCSYHYQGSTLEECEEGYVADYLHLFYSCLPDNITGPVGFTAHANVSRQFNPYGVIIFDEVSSNFGNHYNPATSSFQCPVTGVYLFSVSYNAMESFRMNIELMRNGYRMAMAFADNDEGVHSHASALVISQCDAGMTVWARDRYGNQMYGNSERRSQFVGYLLHRL